jgi:hypothetical protein
MNRASDRVRILKVAMADQILGRESELGSLCAFLDRRVEAPVGLVLEGERGDRPRGDSALPALQLAGQFLHQV